MSSLEHDPFTEKDGDGFPNPEKGIILGVCKNFAIDVGFPIWLVRALFILLCLWLHVFAIVGYLVAFGLFYSRMPGARMRRQRVFKTRTHHRTSRSGIEQQARQLGGAEKRTDIAKRRTNLGSVQKSLRNCEARVRRMEAYVTSDRFRFDQEYRTLH